MDNKEAFDRLLEHLYIDYHGGVCWMYTEGVTLADVDKELSDYIVNRKKGEWDNEKKTTVPTPPSAKMTTVPIPSEPFIMFAKVTDDDW